jgi:hypothetical protein
MPVNQLGFFGMTQGFEKEYVIYIQNHLNFLSFHPADEKTMAQIKMREPPSLNLGLTQKHPASLRSASRTLVLLSPMRLTENALRQS